MLKLHYAPNTIAVASALALNETGQEHALVRVDFACAEQTKPAYHKVNPKGRVPALETEHGILTETIAILEYVGASLVPDDPWKAAKMREVMTYLATTAHVNHAHKMRGHRWADRTESWEDMTAKVPETMTASAAYLDAMIAGPFVFGDALSLADPYLYAVAVWLEGDGVTVSDFPKISGFLEAMEARASVAKARADGVIA
ncbi:MAG: glutathione S-transferase family protein [Pseudomonadota bacterium]